MSDNPLENLNLTNNFMFVKTFSQADIFEQTTTLLLGEKVTVSDKNLVEYEKISERVKFIRNSESIKEEYNMLNLYENEIYADALSKGEQLGEAKGKLEGKLFTLISLVKDGIIESSVAAKRLNISEENFLSKMKEAETTIQS